MDDLRYTLKRSARKTLSILIRDGQVEIRAPLRMPIEDIRRFVVSKEKWISEKLEQSREQLARREGFALGIGDTVTLLGQSCVIRVVDTDHIGFDGSSFLVPARLADADIKAAGIKAACVQIYRMVAKKHLVNRVKHFAELMSVKPAGVRITSAKTRWGSCSAKRSLSFSWRLIMADEETVDYVVVHELAHLVEMNHSDRFWAVVRGVLPDYRTRQQRLKELQARLADEDWGI